MMKRLLRTLFALSLLLTAAPSRSAYAQADGPVAREMTDEEGREARSLALRFMERLRETDDFGPLVAEFFPEDFAERLGRVVRDAPAGGDDDFLFAFDRGLLARTDASELRRGYVAFLNFWNQQDRLGDAAFDYANLECGLAGRERPCGWGRHYALAREAVPPEAFHLAATDPLLEALFGTVGNDEAAGTGAASEAEQAAAAQALMIRDAARLRSFIDKLERCVAPLRAARAKLRSEAHALAAAHDEAEEFRATVAARDELKVYHLKGETVGEDGRGAGDFGLPEGALLIRARVYPFELAMTRAGGRLKILAVYPDFDGD